MTDLSNPEELEAFLNEETPPGGENANTGGQNPEGGGEETSPVGGEGGTGGGTGEEEGKGKETPAGETPAPGLAGKTEEDEFKDLEDLEDFAETPAKPGKKVEVDEPTDDDPSIGIVTPQESVDLYRALKAAAPDFIKQHPEARAAIFKSGQYEQFFPTVKDAAEAVTVREVYDKMEQEVSRGNIKPIFNALRKNSPETLKVVAQDLMEALGDVELQNLAAEPVVRSLLSAALSEAETTNNKNLALAAKYLISYAYGTKGGQLPPPRQRGAQPGSAQDPLAAERKQLRDATEAIAMRDYMVVQQKIGLSVEDNIKKYVGKHIDPEKKMNDFTRDAAVNSVWNELVDLLGKNTAHVRNLTNLYGQIRQNPQKAEQVGAAIRRAIAASAKPHLPKLISEKRAKALGITLEKPTTKAGGNKNLPGGGSGGTVGGGSGKSVNFGGLKSKDIDYDRTSEDDILDGKVQLRKK